MHTFRVKLISNVFLYIYTCTDASVRVGNIESEYDSKDDDRQDSVVSGGSVVDSFSGSESGGSSTYATQNATNRPSKARNKTKKRPGKREVKSEQGELAFDTIDINTDDINAEGVLEEGRISSDVHGMSVPLNDSF